MTIIISAAVPQKVKFEPLALHYLLIKSDLYQSNFVTQKSAKF